MNKNNEIVTVALIGNPNCGKTTLFNRLTGAHQKVGNWTGVTVEKKEGFYKKNKNVKIVDLPGIYSFDTKSEDEKAVTDYLKNNKPDLIINVVDGKAIRRSFELTKELLKIGITTIIAINFSDELSRLGITVDFNGIENELGVYCRGISALRGNGVDDILKRIFDGGYKQKRLINKDFNIDDFIIKKPIKEELTEKIDRVLLNKFLAPVFFVVIITVMYSVSIMLGNNASKYVEAFFDLCINGGYKMVENLFGIMPITSFTVCVLSGLKSVFCLLPQILIMFAFLSVLEQSGYMARVAYILDGFFGKIGQNGKSAIPLILASGCTVTGLMATRTIENKGERDRTIISMLYIPCGAKMTVIAFFTKAFFNDNFFVSVALYFLSFLLAGIISFFNKNEEKESDFFLEMPVYRLPSVKRILFVMLEKIKDFTLKAGTVIMSVSIILWCLKSFNFYGYTTDVTKSFLFYIGSGLKYLLYPLGIKRWECGVAFASGFLAKEAVVETLGVLGVDCLTLFSNSFSAFAYVCFVLFSPPCVASIFQLGQELKDKKRVVKILLTQFLVAYGVAVIINFIGNVIFVDFNLLLIVFVGIIILVNIKSLIKNSKICSGCMRDCSNCKRV